MLTVPPLLPLPPAERTLSADLVEQLRVSLGATYTIVRELGGGGMSRVFLAQDIALGRQVVIKVLLPELAAGVNAERFDREVLLSARLQHPHIVPVLTAGQVNGLPFYVMPYVKGETLRARMAGGPLPIPEVISILSDVAKALAFAQSEQVVHRDIKPDNILLSGGAATVADFGIAKAISTARQSEAGATLTSLGTSLGTPAYMAPEQVAGDPDVDHRADIYSLGCVAYEMLTGRAPFEGKSPQQLLAAHVLESPRSLPEQRSGIPASLVALVNRCMAKEPAARPQSATELVTQLESTDTHEVVSVVPARRSRRSLGLLVGAAIVLAIAAVPVYRLVRKAPVASGALTFAVAPFEVFDPQLALWKEGIVDVLSRNLDGAGPLRAIAPGVAIKRWEGHGDRTSATKFGKTVGAQLVVYGQLQAAGHDLVEAKVWIVDTQRDVAPQELTWRDSTARMDRVTDSLSVKVLSAIGRDHVIGAGRIASLGSGSLPAIKAFLQGSQHLRHSQWDSAAIAFKEAVARDSTFGIAYLQLGQALGWKLGTGNPEVNEANSRAGALVRAGLSPHDSLLLTAIGHYSHALIRGQRNLPELRLAVNAARAATERYPNDAQAWYMLGDFRYHGDLSLTWREALDYFDHAIAADSDFTPAYIHAIDLAYRNGTALGRRYAEAYLRRDPRDFDGEGVKFAEALTNPRVSAKELQPELDKLPDDAGRKAYTALSHAPDSAEAAVQLLRSLLNRQADSVRRNPPGVVALELARRGHISEAWNLAIKTRQNAAAEIAALGLVPLDRALTVMRPWLKEQNDAAARAVPVLAMAHDTAAIKTLALTYEQYLQQHPTLPQRPAVEYLIAQMHAYTALAKGDTVLATRLFEALPDSVISFPLDELTHARLIGRQNPQRALRILERVQGPGLIYAARELERGRLAERIGDRARAVDAFSYVAAVWRNTDSPQLKEGVKEAKDALLRLDADSHIRNVIGNGGKP